MHERCRCCPLFYPTLLTLYCGVTTSCLSQQTVPIIAEAQPPASRGLPLEFPPLTQSVVDLYTVLSLVTYYIGTASGRVSNPVFRELSAHSTDQLFRRGRDLNPRVYY